MFSNFSIQNFAWDFSQPNCRDLAEDTPADPYLSCSQSGGRVVSQVFCLPTDYRKDLLPSCKSDRGGMSAIFLNFPLPQALSALTVYFKLPIYEISEIDDHKSVVQKVKSNLDLKFSFLLRL